MSINNRIKSNLGEERKGFLGSSSREGSQGRNSREPGGRNWSSPQPIHSRPKSINSSQSIQAQQTRLSFLTFTFIFNSMYTCLSVCPYFHTEVRKGQWIPWSWSYRRLWTPSCRMLGTKVGFSARAVYIPNHWAVFSVLKIFILTLIS